MSVSTDERFAAGVWEILKRDANDLRKQQAIVNLRRECAPCAEADEAVYAEVRELIREHWTCWDGDNSGPECAAVSPCPGCERRKLALSLLGDSPTKAEAER